MGLLRVSRDKWAPRPAGRPELPPPAPQLQQQTSPPAPRPAWPPPAPSAPAAQPSALPGGPAYLREAACPGEESSQGLRRGRSDLAPSPLARTLLPPPPPPRAALFRAPSRSGGHPTPGRLGKACTAVPRRAAAPHRAAPGSAVQPLPALVPARSFGARTPGRWRSQPPRLVLSAGTRLLSPHCRPESPGAQAHSSRLASARNPRK